MRRADFEKRNREVLIITILVVVLLALLIAAIYSFAEGEALYPISLLVLTGLFSMYVIEKNTQLKETMHRLEIERFQTLLNSLLKITIELTDANRGSIMLIDEETGTLGVVSPFNMDMNAVVGSWALMGDGIAGHVAQTGEPVFLSGPVEDSRFRKLVRKTDHIKEAICVPINSGQDVIGALSVSLIGEVERSFTDAHQYAVRTFAMNIVLDKESIALLIHYKKKGLL